MKLKKKDDKYKIPKEHNSDRIPLSGPFTIVSILGFLISVTFTVSGRFNQWFLWAGENAGNTWGFLFTLFFLMLLIASMVSITPKGEF
jgi:hypothetical protein